MNTNYDTGYNIGHQSGYKVGVSGGEYDPGHDHCSVAYNPSHPRAYDSYDSGHHHGYDAGYHKGRRDLQHSLDDYSTDGRSSPRERMRKHYQAEMQPREHGRFASKESYDSGRTREDYERGRGSSSSYYGGMSYSGSAHSSPRRRRDDSGEDQMYPRMSSDKFM